MAPTLRQMRQRARPSHIRVLVGQRHHKPQLERARDTLTRWGAHDGIRLTAMGERLLAILRAEGRAA